MSNITLNLAQNRANQVWYTLRGKYAALGSTSVLAVLNNRFKTTAGMMYVQTRRMELCTQLLEEYPQEFHDVIIPHEVCHQAAYDIFGDMGHGKGWKTVMLSFGLQPDRCHTLINTKWAAARAGVKL